MTGVPAVTLRMWERRYGVPRPSRRDGGHRVYGQAEIERLRLVAKALAAGHRARDVVPLSLAALQKLDAEFSRQFDSASSAAPALQRCLDALLTKSGGNIGMELRRAALLFGPVRFVTDVAGPLAVRVGEMWESGKLDVFQEHLFTSSLTTQLRVLLATFDGLERPPTIVLATLSEELHALGLEMVAVFVAAHGGSPRLLGPNLPPREIAAAARRFGADAIGISISAAARRAEAERRVRELVEEADATPIWLGGAGSSGLRIAGRPTVIDGWADLSQALTKLARAER